MMYRNIIFSLLLSLSCFCNAAVHTHEWNITWAIVAPDCVTKKVATINGQYPGPKLEVTEGDRVVIKICNNVFHGVTMHWHGLHLKNYQWYDGAAFGIQCPIRKGECFTYNFTIEGQHGTYFYHAHAGLIRNTLYGSLIIHPKNRSVVPFSTPAGEFSLLLNDWYHKYNGDIEAGLVGIPWSFIGAPDSFLINGRGIYYCQQYQCIYPNNPSKCGVCNRSNPHCNPLSTFVVESNKTYRFRLSNLALWGQMNFAIEGHSFTLVMADGHYVKPKVLDSIDINPGEAYDLLVKFDQEPKNYWIAINGRYDNLGMDPPGLAVIKYKGNKWFDQPQPYTAFPTGPDYTDLTFGPNQEQSFFHYTTVEGLKERKVDKYFSLLWAMNEIDRHIRYSVNNVSFYRSTTPILAAEYFNITRSFVKENLLDPHFSLPSNKAGLQPAKYGTSYIPIKKGEFVQFVLQNHNPPGGNHPWHLHGFDFYIVGHGTGIYNSSLEKEYEKTYNLVNPPLRSMVTIYEGTFAVIRFEANNPGLWNFHCHMDPHVALGMQVFLRVIGEPGDIPPPPEDYRKCGKLRKLVATFALRHK